jgi:small subunit ribosomal protein S6
VNDYEILLIIDPEATEERSAEILTRARELVEQGGGTFEAEETWGRRRLAYEIDHKSDGAYHLLQFEGPKAVLDALNRTLHITDGVTRYRIIKLRPGTPPAPDVRQDVPAPRAADEGTSEGSSDEPAEPATPAEPAPAA